MLKREVVQRIKKINSSLHGREIELKYTDVINHVICERCGKEIDTDNLRLRYCDECRKIVNNEKAAERMRKYRERKAQANKDK